MFRQSKKKKSQDLQNEKSSRGGALYNTLIADD